MQFNKKLTMLSMSTKVRKA